MLKVKQYDEDSGQRGRVEAHFHKCKGCGHIYKTREKYMYNMKKNTCPADVVEKGSIVVFRRELDKYMVKKMFQGYGERAGSWNKGIALVESQHGHNVSNAHLCHDYFRFYDIYLF